MNDEGKKQERPENFHRYVKFAQASFLHESFLKQQGIVYEESDLEDTPFGKAYRMPMTEDK